jgi:hypothetical protein
MTSSAASDSPCSVRCQHDILCNGVHNLGQIHASDNIGEGSHHWTTETDCFIANTPVPAT